MIRVLVVDDHPIVRAGIVGLLDTEPDFEVVAEASSGEEAIELVSRHRPDVVLMDLRMPGIGGVEATRRLVQSPELGSDPDPDSGTGTGPGQDPGRVVPARRGAEREVFLSGARPRVLVFTTYEDDDQILAAIEAGASGYLVKAAPAEELAAGVRAVAAGQTVLAPSVAAALAQAARGGSQAVARGGSGANDASDPAPSLTPREREILALVAEGLSNPEIAARLFIGDSTVKTHLLHVFEKLAVSDRTRAVIRAMELGLL